MLFREFPSRYLTYLWKPWPIEIDHKIIIYLLYLNHHLKEYLLKITIPNS